MLSRILPFIAMLVAAFALPFSVSGQMSFSELNYDQLRSQAQKTESPFVVYLHQSDHRACKKMDRKTWRDPELVSFVSKNFLISRLNPLQGTRQMQLVQEFGVFSYPSFLFFSPQGKLLGKAEGYLAPATLRLILQKHLRQIRQQEDVRLWAIHNQGPLPGHSATIAIASSQEEEQAPTEASMSLSMLAPPLAQLESIMRTRGMNDGNTHRLILKVPGLEAYSLQNLRLPRNMPLSYGLLMGSFTSYKSLQKELNQLKRYWKEEIWVYCEEINQIPVYKLVLGVYPSEEDAESFAHAIYKIQGLNPVILDLSVFLR
jgi:thioredoxin-related protein